MISDSSIPQRSHESHEPRSRPWVMAILNATPDSFSDGGRYSSVDAAVAYAESAVEAGADILDLGGESTRPGSDEVSEAEELARVRPILEALEGRLPVPISVDTRRASVAEVALECGATWINDTSALRDDPRLASVVAASDARVVLMHRRGVPRTMQEDPRYHDPVREVREFFEERVRFATDRGIDLDRIVLDPGLGFGKRPEDNDRLVAGLDALRVDDLAILIGASRKSFVARFDDAPAADRLAGSLAYVAASAHRGADGFRVHDVRETVALLDALTAIDVSESEATWAG